MTKLTHQPFSDWLLAAEPLPPEEAQRLVEHLHTCPECQQLQSAWSQTRRLFTNTSQLTPAPGFVNRWQQRLAHQRQLHQRKIAWVWFGVTAGLASMALAYLGYQAFASLQSPLSYLAVWIYRWTVAASYWNTLAGYLNFFQRVIPNVSAVGLIFLVGFASFLSVSWLATYRRLSSVRRVVI